MVDVSTGLYHVPGVSMGYSAAFLMSGIVNAFHFAWFSMRNVWIGSFLEDVIRSWWPLYLEFILELDGDSFLLVTY